MKRRSPTTLSAGTRRLTGLLLLELRHVRWSRHLEKWLAAWQPAGVILGGSRLATPGATAELLAKIARALDAPPILALREAGAGYSPPGSFHLHIASARAAGRKGPSAAKKLGDLLGATMKLVGFNTYFGPSLDLSAPFSDALLNHRLFSSDPERVARCGEAFIQGLGRNGMAAAPGHFPGISDATQDRVSGMHVVDRTMAEMWGENLIPFRRLLPRSPFVVISHLPYKAYDMHLERLACTSARVLQGLLREKLGFRGAAIADFPGAVNLLSTAPSLASNREDGTCTGLDPAALVDSLAAGCDLQVVGPGEKWSRLVLAQLESAMQSGAVPEQRLEEAARRVRAAKKALRRPSGRFNAKAFDKLARKFEDLARTCR